MDQEHARQTTEDFLRKYLADNDQLRSALPLPEGATGELAGPFELEAVVPGTNEHALSVHFLASFKFRFTDAGVHFRANHCVAALHKAHPELRAFKFEISVRSLEAIEQ